MVTLHGRLELVNGICLAAFRKDITAAASEDALASLEEDFADRRYLQVDVLWRAALRRAEALSRAGTSKFGSRSLDVIHVATALELGLPDFVSFDARQQRLARASGLKVLRV